MTRRAVVLGAGVAGMTAAFGLADRGFAVTLLEPRGWLGGRAFAFVDRHSGRRLDNGPHVMLGCYRAMRALVRRLGTEQLFQQDRSLTMAYRRAGGEVTTLRLAAVPVPIAMPLGLLRLRIGFLARFRALWGMASSLFGAREDWTIEDWANRRHQRGDPTDLLWEPLCRAIMNVEMREAAAADFLVTLREAFSGRAGSAAFWLPRATWSEILGDPAPAALAAAGVELRTGVRAVEFAADAGRIGSIGLSDGDRVQLEAGDVVVSAMPWSALSRLVPELPFRMLRGSPIVSAHFATEAPVLADDGPVVALPGGEPFHFVLRTPGADRRHFAMLAGGNRALDGMKVEAIEAAARAQLQRHYPDFAETTQAHVRISRENAATFVAAPGSRALRPAPGPLQGGPENLSVCGDWTATGLPSTLEGAARSAEALLRTLPDA